MRLGHPASGVCLGTRQDASRCPENLDRAPEAAGACMVECLKLVPINTNLSLLRLVLCVCMHALSLARSLSRSSVPLPLPLPTSLV